MSKTIILQAPVVMKIQADDDVLSGFAKLATYALATAQKTFADKGVDVVIDGEQAVVSFTDDGVLSSFTMGGIKLDDRHFRVMPDDKLGHGLELSSDRGGSFTSVASFSDAAVADKFGRSWVAGRAESDQ